MGKCIMLQGTASSVGKSLLTAALCRIFKQDGLQVAPFKSQNMALNSFITREGLEMGRAQVVQAQAAGLEPDVLMNPVLLKPTCDHTSQVIVMGKVYQDMSAAAYHAFKPELKEIVRQAFETLQGQNDVVVIEGAGSPAEINLRDKDIVNMGMAEIADAPVLLIGDIDKGGVFASLAGTMLLLTPEERKRVKGVIINKFRGDVEILKPGLQMLEDIIHVPVLGVVPYANVNIEDEDSVSERFYKRKSGKSDVRIAVVWLRHVSNFTDFVPLEQIPGVSVEYVTNPRYLSAYDMVILPGSKSTIDDMRYLRESGFDIKIKEYANRGGLVFGVCGGYQLLGRKISDPYGVDGPHGEIEGLGLLQIDTVFQKEKITAQTQVTLSGSGSSYLQEVDGAQLKGYEIHMGRSEGAQEPAFTMVEQRNGAAQKETDGVRNKKGNVMGTYLHGIFDNTTFTNGLINAIKKTKGLASSPETMSFQDFREGEYDKLADAVRQSLDMEAIYRLIQ